MSQRISKFQALSLDQRRSLLAAFLLLPLVWIALRLFGLGRVKAWVRQIATEPRRPDAFEEICALGRVVNAAANHALLPVTCLSRSVVLHCMLKQRGVFSDLRIGVRLRDSALEAHAWVECEGIPVNDVADIAIQFAPFDADLPNLA